MRASREHGPGQSLNICLLPDEPTVLYSYYYNYYHYYFYYYLIIIHTDTLILLFTRPSAQELSNDTL